jgi:hypothetical protein
MTHGFDLDSPLVCEGIIGDGCGGGRLFMIENETLKAYDPTTKESFTLLGSVLNAVSISKSACIITIVCLEREIKFDLSALKQV